MCPNGKLRHPPVFAPPTINCLCAQDAKSKFCSKLHYLYWTLKWLLLSVCSAALHCIPDTKPTLPELLRFTCTDGRVLNTPVEIATKYVNFGIFLLDDRNGSRVKIIAHRNLNNAEQINTELLQEWLTGRGKQPVTWATLVEVLRDIQLSALADEIKAVKCLQDQSSKT